MEAISSYIDSLIRIETTSYASKTTNPDKQIVLYDRQRSNARTRKRSNDQLIDLTTNERMIVLSN